MRSVIDQAGIPISMTILRLCVTEARRARRGATCNAPRLVLKGSATQRRWRGRRRLARNREHQLIDEDIVM